MDTDGSNTKYNFFKSFLGLKHIQLEIIPIVWFQGFKLNSLSPGRSDFFFFFKFILVIKDRGISCKLPADECHWTLMMISQRWFREWFGAIMQQAITWANVDPELCHHIAALGHNEWKINHFEEMLISMG